jgi:hypothetical protein
MGVFGLVLRSGNRDTFAIAMLVYFRIAVLLSSEFHSCIAKTLGAAHFFHDYGLVCWSIPVVGHP